MQHLLYIRILHMTIMMQNKVGTEAMASNIRGEQILSLVSAVSDGYLDMLFRCITLAILATLVLCIGLIS